MILAFGCQPVFTSEGKEWIKSRIIDAAQVTEVEIPDVRLGRTGEILEKMAEMLESLPESTLIRLPDIQSPLGVAELMWDQSFYMALLINPEEVHQLLEKISRFTIDYIKAIRELLGNRYNPATHPQIWAPGEGYYMSDDVNSMLSPEQHMEFSINYINRITTDLGPLFYHSCTWTDPYFENMEKLEKVRAINWSFGTSADPAELIQRFSAKYLLTPHIDRGVHLEEGITSLNRGIKSEYDLTRYLLDHMQANTSMYIWFQSDLCKELEQMKKIYQLLRERG
jgi:uroporphyrinogen-III decarboxylase